MNITLDKSSTTEASLKIALTPEDYQPQVDKKIKEYTKQANIKGFRPGKVPASVIQRLYGKSILVDEVNETLSKAVNDYLRESKLLVVGDPMPDREKANEINWDTQKEFEFVYNLGLASDFDIDFTKLPEVNAFEIQAGEKEYEDTLADLKKRTGEHAHVEEVTAGDLVYGTFKQGEYTEKSAIPTDKLTEEALAWFLGKKKDEVLTFDIQKLFADANGLKLATSREDLSGEFEFTIEDITRNQEAELNQEFFDKVLGPGKASSEEEFKTELTNIIQENYKREAEFLLRDDIQKMLLENVQIELPNEFLKQWLLETNQGEITEEEVEKDFDKFASDLRWTLIRNKVAEAADIKVEAEDVNTYAEAMVRQQFGIYGDDNGMGDVIKKVAQNYLQENKGQNYMNVFNRVYGGKTMDFILTQVKTNAQPIDVESFKAKSGLAE